MKHLQVVLLLALIFCILSAFLLAYQNGRWFVWMGEESAQQSPYDSSFFLPTKRLSANNSDDKFIMELFRARIARPMYDVDCERIFSKDLVRIWTDTWKHWPSCFYFKKYACISIWIYKSISFDLFDFCIEYKKFWKNLLKELKTKLQEIRNKRADKRIELLDTKNFIFPPSMCVLYKQVRLGHRPFYNQPPTNQMAIAFTILLNDDIEQFERFLKTIYHPNNVYCVHVDAKSSEDVKNAVKSIANCFDNVFVATELENVMWASFTLLKAQINCMSDLVNLTNLVDQHEYLMAKRVVDWEYLNSFFYFDLHLIDW